jgi:hypothetical protein
MATRSDLFKFLLISAIFLCYQLFRNVLRKTESLHIKAFALSPAPARLTLLNNEPVVSTLQQIFRGEIGVRERSGRNDGHRIEQYLRFTGLKPGYPWCAAFVAWCFGQAGIPAPRSAYCPSFFPQSRTIWKRSANPDPPPRPGDVFGIYFPEKGRIAHMGFVDSWNDKFMISVEGNTNLQGSREGDGVYRKRRLTNSIARVARWHQ